MAYTGTDAKEQTIRGLVAECRKAQTEIRLELGKHFERTPPKEVKDGVAARPTHPNVLDEIMDDLKALRDAQQKTIELITTCINPKL